MNAETEILVKMLAVTDAIFGVVRTEENNRRGQTTVARRNFAKHGSPYASGKADDAGRKAAERALAVLVENGKAIGFRPGRVKTTTVKLTDAGEAEARAVVGLPGFAEAWTAMGEVRDLTKAKAQLMTDVWISEERLTGCKWGTRSERVYVGLEYAVMPCLIRGFIKSNTGGGRAYYRLTDEGRDALTREPPPDSEEPRDEEARTLYKARLHAELSQLGKPKAACFEIGPLPLPVAIEGLELMDN